MNITRLHVLGTGTRVYQKGVMIQHVHEVSVPTHRSTRERADIWFRVDFNGGVEPRNLVKMDDLDIQFTLIFMDRWDNPSILWSNESAEHQAKAWETLGEGRLAIG